MACQHMKIKFVSLDLGKLGGGERSVAHSKRGFLLDDLTVAQSMHIVVPMDTLAGGFSSQLYSREALEEDVLESLIKLEHMQVAEGNVSLTKGYSKQQEQEQDSSVEGLSPNLERARKNAKAYFDTSARDDGDNEDDEPQQGVQDGKLNRFGYMADSFMVGDDSEDKNDGTCHDEVSDGSDLENEGPARMIPRRKTVASRRKRRTRKRSYWPSIRCILHNQDVRLRMRS